MSIYDYIVIGVYLTFMLSLGSVYKSFSKTASDFFRGGGSMLWWVVGSSAFMTQFSAWSFTGGAAKAYETGTFFLILFICNAGAALFTLFFTAHRFRQMRVITPVEAIRNRFGDASEQIFTWMPLLFTILFGGVSLYTISVFMSGVFGANMTLIVLLLGSVMIIMTLLGGSWAATAGDFVQMIIVLMITVIMAILTLRHDAIGGIGGLIEKMPSQHLTWTEFARPSVIVIFVVMLLINQIISGNSMQTGAARYLFVKDGRDARKAAIISFVGFLALPIIWIIPAIGTAILFPDLSGHFPQLNNPSEGAYVAIAMELLPQGLLGLLVCGIFAASITSMNSSLNTNSANFVRNFYIRIIDKEASEAKQIFLGRVFIFLYGSSWIIVALFFSRVKTLELFDLILIVAASIGLPAALPLTYGMFFRKTPSWTGWSTMLLGFTVSLIDRVVLTEAFFQRIWSGGPPLTRRELGDLDIAFTTGTIFIACSGWFFFTKLFYRHSKLEYREQVDHFFTEMNTPIERSPDDTPAHETDQRQYRVLANLCLVYGGLTLLLVAVPNEMKSRLLILICGSAVVSIGWIIRSIGKRLESSVDPSS